MLTRRNFLKGLGYFGLAGFSTAGYAFGVEPFRCRIQRYTVTPRLWPKNLKLKIAGIADVHACEPWMNIRRIRHIVETTNALEADLIVLLGDYTAGHHWVTAGVTSNEWAKAFADLNAPLGVHAVLGNHDWWDDFGAQARGHGPIIARLALERVGIPVYENDAIRLDKDGSPFWLAGLGDQIALVPKKRWRRKRWQGVDDLTGTLAKITDDAPLILMAHEPDIFPLVPDRVALTLSGHTHGGQLRLLGYSPIVPSRYGNRFSYGHVIENERHLVISGGLGCSIAPIRMGVPPEIILVEMSGSLGENA